MAITQYDVGPTTFSARKYVGLSADTKPTTGVPAGSTFIERDTGLTFIWDGTAWGQLIYPTSVA